jgi:hypothetical protein
VLITTARVNKNDTLVQDFEDGFRKFIQSFPTLVPYHFLLMYQNLDSLSII